MHLEAQSEILIELGDWGCAEAVCEEKELVSVSKSLLSHVKQCSH